jgi:hypothetical protein
MTEKTKFFSPNEKPLKSPEECIYREGRINSHLLKTKSHVQIIDELAGRPLSMESIWCFTLGLNKEKLELLGGIEDYCVEKCKLNCEYNGRKDIRNIKRTEKEDEYAIVASGRLTSTGKI